MNPARVLPLNLGLAIVSGAKERKNMGFPTEPVEFEHFIKMLQAGNPKLTLDKRPTGRLVLVARALETES